MLIRFAMLALLALLPLCFTTAADAQSAAQNETLEIFKSMSPADRDLLLNQALESYRNMSPAEQKALEAQARAQVDSGAAASGEWEKLLSPEQMKMISSQIEPSLKTDPAQKTAAPAQQATMAALLAQIRKLPPNEQQTILNALKNQNAATPAPAATPTTTAAAPAAPPADPCAEYKTANPAFYANCTKRMNPNGAK